MDHFHLPLQSGSDHILKLMRRKYSISEYQEKLMMVKEYFPSAGIGADIITGFPGESDEEFEKTMNFLRENPVTHFHPFPYSQRKKYACCKDGLPCSSNGKEAPNARAYFSWCC